MLDVIDLKLETGRVKADVTRLIARPDRPLRIHLGAPREPAGLVMLAGGLLHVTGADPAATEEFASRLEVLGTVDDATNCRWAGTAYDGARLAVLVLPAGHTMIRPDPAPIAVRVLGGRLVVFLSPAEHAIGWLMIGHDGDLGAEASRLARGSPTGGSLADLPGITVVETERPVRRRLGPVLLSAVLAAVIIPLAILLSRPGEPAEDGLRGLDLADESPTRGTVPGKSYALVVGIDRYPSSRRFPDLSYARRDAEGTAAFLRRIPFDEVIALYDDQATKRAIVGAMQNRLAPRLESGDRVLVFFAGHGHTETLGGRDWGYLVPFDGTDQSASYLSMEEIRTLSEKMGRARHQLFLVDACHGGLLGTRSGAIDPARPGYIDELMRREARHVLTAGGADQSVADGGPDGHSLFTGHLLRGLGEGLADLNGDGFIPFSELVAYLVPLAGNRHQTPAWANLPGHGLGEFVFRVPPRPVDGNTPR